MASMFRATRDLKRRVPNWAIGIAVATPLAATLQGVLMLQQYRRDHGHAPFPISPSQGLVVVSSSTQTPTSGQENVTKTKPLRLLVIGDSLAAGVGISQSGTPILPQSIARALSGASNGRAVHWTCIGTPGASASQIIHDLGAYQDSPSLLERKHIEFQVTERKAKEWWEQRKKLAEKEEETKENKNRIQQWWSHVRRDVETLRASLKDAQKEAALQTKLKLTRRKTLLDPEVATHYDIAVVLTGINDLKDAFLPFMMRGKNASSTVPDGQSGSLKEALLRIVHALQDKMPLDLSKNDDDESTMATSSTHTANATRQAQQDTQQRHRGPLVVFPGMPASPLPLTHYPPLSWFLVPLIKMMDTNKKLLAQRFPEIVLYVDPPSPNEFRNEELGRGEVHASRRGEQVLLQLTNVTQRAQEKVKELMNQHYKSNSIADDAEKGRKEEKPLVYSQNCREHQLIEPQHTPGSTLIAEDRIHPNDAGYDFWGRHIAAAIVREWKDEEHA